MAAARRHKEILETEEVLDVQTGESHSIPARLSDANFLARLIELRSSLCERMIADLVLEKRAVDAEMGNHNASMQEALEPQNFKTVHPDGRVEVVNPSAYIASFVLLCKHHRELMKFVRATKLTRSLNNHFWIILCF